MTLPGAASEIGLGSNDPFSSEQPVILPADEAFMVNWTMQPSAFSIRFTMPPGYYLYRHAFELSESGADRAFGIPDGIEMTDEFFGDVEVYRGEVVVDVPLEGNEEAIAIRYQGCADAGYCYPPRTARFSIGELR